MCWVELRADVIVLPEVAEVLLLPPTFISEMLLSTCKCNINSIKSCKIFFWELVYIHCKSYSSGNGSVIYLNPFFLTDWTIDGCGVKCELRVMMWSKCIKPKLLLTSLELGSHELLVSLYLYFGGRSHVDHKESLWWWISDMYIRAGYSFTSHGLWYIDISLFYLLGLNDLYFL